MKKMLLACLTGAALLPAQAQLFSPDSLSGALWGGLIGGIVGGDCRHGFSGETAAIGAGVGLIAGALSGEARRHDYYDSPHYAYSTAPSVTLGYGYGNRSHSGYVYYSPNYYTAPGYYYQEQRANTQPVVQYQAQQPASTPATQESPTEVTSKPCTTSTYTWTTRPQIPDAPRVPDAPKF